MKFLNNNLELLIALTLILSCVALMFSGVNGEVKTVFALAAAWAFRSRLHRHRD